MERGRSHRAEAPGERAPYRVVRPGKPYPLGATWDGEGVNFALFSEHATAVELCLFDETGMAETARLRMPEYTDQVWHLYLPEARPGLLYSYRVHGPYDPGAGHRFNPHKLLLDPYARSFRGKFRWNDAHFGYRFGSIRGDLSYDRRDNARYMPKCEVIENAFTWGDDRPPRRDWADTVIYEAHLRGLTIRHPEVDPARRGSCAGLASPPMLDYLLDLGVTAIELLPIHAFLDDRRLVQAGLRNYWGYNSFGYFAPDPRFLSSGRIDEFKTMVKRLHDVGIEIILDVVYNHTAEADEIGPTLSFRGIDNRSYYRLGPDPRYYVNDTGCGNTLNLQHPRVLQMVMDSLRYWVEEMHVDGFRFDLCTSLARERHGFDPGSGYLDAVRQDPVLNQVKLIAEPWDLGPQGYQLGGFPPGWSEWNAAYRDTVRRFWRGDAGAHAELGSRLAGSSDIFARLGRRPSASINFATAHDGFTLHDLVSYENKHNEANGEDNRDGTNDNFSWASGVEGETEDAEIRELRNRQKRNILATLFLSLGVPMLLAGDEFGRTQRGNNNAYCQDNVISWLNWSDIGPEDERLRAFVRYLIRLRRGHRVFTRHRFLRGEVVSASGLKDITWLTPDGREFEPADWAHPSAHCLGVLLCGAAGEFYTAGGQRDIDQNFLMLVNAYQGVIDFDLPPMVPQARWAVLVDTAEPTGFPAEPAIYRSNERFPLRSRSLALLIDRGVSIEMALSAETTEPARGPLAAAAEIPRRATVVETEPEAAGVEAGSRNGRPLTS